MIARRFGSVLGLNCLELTGDYDPEHGELDSADIICTTPEKFDAVTRKLNERGGATFFSEVCGWLGPAGGRIHLRTC